MPDLGKVFISLNSLETSVSEKIKTRVTPLLGLLGNLR